MMAYVRSHTKRYTQLQQLPKRARTDWQQDEPIESMRTSVTAVFSGRGRSTIPLFRSTVPFHRSIKDTRLYKERAHIDRHCPLTV